MRFQLVLGVSYIQLLNCIWQECESSSDKTLRYSMKLEKPGICFTENCDEDEEQRNREILSSYSSLFHTRPEIIEIEREEIRDRLHRAGVDISVTDDVEITERFPDSGAPSRTDRPSRPIQTDFDMCCSTEHSHMLFHEITNTNNERRTVVHFEHLNPPRYQFVPVGMCVAGNNYCGGQCLQEYREHYILVHDPTATYYPGVTFDRFRVESYCSCKNITP